MGTAAIGAVRNAAEAIEQLAGLRGDAQDTLAEIRTAAQTGSLAFAFVTIVALVGLVIASAALVRVALIESGRPRR